MPGYLTTQAPITIEGAADLIIRSLLDRQQFADTDGQAEAVGVSSATWPLFGMLWPSALQLAAWMARRPLVAGERILEVGCGLGLASLVSHRRGADVTASDCHPLVPEFLSVNLGLNGLMPLPYRHGNWALRSDADVPGLSPSVQGEFDLIMGSDVLYERDEDGALSHFIVRHAAPQAQVLIVDPNRGNRAAFSRRMAAAGFTLDETDLSQPATEATQGQAYRGRLLRYARGAVSSTC
ncbi:SAM-dependent methyltransferase [Aquabacterium lacunae]|uniref:SAM-dependent methyltransferase n=1 Tax=Aquabacterium lacunae TaxID=2528630 RepID=A0A4V6MTR3_9BURK|nr:SAM-dependent methyltransferase [Aquabacterium lacunae]TBO31148.1 SAM-dependent methyltransferase [Aquabacterium lacunae]